MWWMWEALPIYSSSYLLPNYTTTIFSNILKSQTFSAGMEKQEFMLQLVKAMGTLTEIARNFEDGNQTSAPGSMKLQFRNKIAQPILTLQEIKGEGDNPIELALIDDSTGNVVDIEPAASAHVEIVLLKGDNWPLENVNENIFGEIDGKNLLTGIDKPLKLQRGIVVLENIQFKSKVRPSDFRLGARVIDTFVGVQIKEARTESFAVKDFRNKYPRNHKFPSLSDAISLLVHIGKGGKLEERLQENKIYTVEDFLIQLLINPQGLQTIVNLGAKRWEATVNNARACSNHTRMYCYINSEQKIGVVFNVLGEVQGFYLSNQYAPTTVMSEMQKVVAQELLSSAYKHWDDVKTCDDQDSLQQHLMGLSASKEGSLKPDYPCKMIGESSSRSNFSVQGITSAMNSVREAAGVEDFSSLGTDDVENISNAFVQSSPLQSTSDPGTTLSDFDESLNKFAYDPITESNGDERFAATAVTLVESRVADVRPQVTEKVDSALGNYILTMKRNGGKDVLPSESRSLKLQFSNAISLPVFTETCIEGVGGTSLKVALVDTLSREVVSTGLGSSAKMEIVVLEGGFDGDERDNWTLEEFKNNIVREREGNKTLLSGDVILTLIDGTGLVGNVVFTDNSSWTRSRKFRLGARLLDDVGDIRVREARSEPFFVTDHCGESFKQRHPTSLPLTMSQKRQRYEEASSFDDTRPRKSPAFKRAVLDVTSLCRLKNFMEPLFEPLIRRVVKEEVNSALRKDIISMKRLPVFTETCIEGEGLGARLLDDVGDIRVREARSEPFVVTDHCGNSYKKHHPPSLSDEVWRLEKIGKDGTFHKHLSKEGVNTVQDFLMLLFLDPTRLRKILGCGMSAKMWELTVEHARTCVLDKKVYCYVASQKNGVVFSVVGQVRGIFSNGQYLPADKLSEAQKAEARGLVMTAFADRDKITTLDDESSLNTPTLSNLPIVQSSSNLPSEGNYHENVSSHNIGPSTYLQQNTPSPDYMQSVYSIGGFDDCLQGVEPVDMRCHQPLNYPGNEHLQYLETDFSIQTSDLDLSWDMQSCSDAFVPCSPVHISKAQKGWNFIFRVLEWRDSIKRVVARKIRV